MKSLTLLAAAAVALAIAPTAQAAPVATVTKTTVTKVHGPLKVLPHHKHKYCRTRWANRHRVKKCWYH